MSKYQPDYLELGDWNAACSMCGRKRKASELVKNWQGMYRCPEHNEPRQPQDFVRPVPDIQTPPWVQPKPDPTYAQPTNFITTSGNASVATTAGQTSILNIYEGVTVPTLTITGSGTLIINNYGIVSAVVNASATLEVHNYGRYP